MVAFMCVCQLCEPKPPRDPYAKEDTTAPGSSGAEPGMFHALLQLVAPRVFRLRRCARVAMRLRGHP